MNLNTKNIEGYIGKYFVTSDGKIIGRSNKSIHQRTDRKGYKRVRLCNNNIHRFVFVHRLVALAFIPNPENKPQINHKNGVKDDNSVENLEWCTASENILDAFKRGRIGATAKGENAPGHKLKAIEIPVIRELLTEGKTLRELGCMFGVSPNTIYSVKSRKNWKHIL
jgi:hypothetical protein